MKKATRNVLIGIGAILTGIVTWQIFKKKDGGDENLTTEEMIENAQQEIEDKGKNQTPYSPYSLSAIGCNFI